MLWSERNLSIGSGKKAKKETPRYIEVIILNNWKKSDTIENREGEQFWLGHTDFEVPVGMKVDMLSKQLEMKAQNN